MSVCVRECACEKECGGFEGDVGARKGASTEKTREKRVFCMLSGRDE